MIIQIKEKLKEIANAIRSVKGTTETIVGNNFADEIKKMAYIENGTISGPIKSKAGSTITPSTSNQVISGGVYLNGNITVQGDSNLKAENIARGRTVGNYIFGVRGTADKIVEVKYEKPIWTGAYANEALKVARSYWDARVSGKVNFVYSGGDTIFEGKLTDSNGKCYIDCSTYILLYLLGIDYIHSPYHKVSGQVNQIIDASTIIPRTDYSYNFSSLVNQSASNFSNGKIRYAADLAEYFYCLGTLIDVTEVMPGDLTFHAAKNKDGTYHINNRFKNISHVGIVAEESYMQRDSNGKVTYFEYYNVTSYEGVCIRTKSTSRSDIVFCCRPDYRPREPISEISSINLISNSYRSRDVGETVLNGVTFNVFETGQITTTGTPTVETTFYITNKSYPISLKKGKYSLTGCPLRADVTTGTTWGLAIRKASDETLLGWDLGNGVEFEITNNFESVYIYIYISPTKDSTGYIWNPKLLRIE